VTGSLEFQIFRVSLHTTTIAFAPAPGKASRRAASFHADGEDA
jgi:hypothetical protein